MVIKKRMKILSIIISLLVILSLVGCISNSTDEVQIGQIADNIEKAIEKKNVDVFMDNVSYDYSDSNGGTFDNHINNLPEELFTKIEDAEDLVDAFFILKIKVKVTIPESDLVITDIYASGKMTIKISLEACVAWVICTDLYNENIEYNVDFIKEEDNWKIISMLEI